jgi:saxitoxin biosynthesis operon SxtJ-like protein
MHWSDIDFQPPERTLRHFGGWWLLFLGGAALWQGIVADRMVSAFILAAVAFSGGVVGWLRPAWLRPIYTTGMVLAFPIGWLVSHVLLALLFFGLFTPLALIFRWVGRDPLQRQPPPARKSYWSRKPAPADVRRYFQPY